MNLPGDIGNESKETTQPHRDGLVSSFDEMIDAADSGDFSIGYNLLDLAIKHAESPEGGLHPSLALYLCQCLKRYADAGFGKSAEAAFNINKPKGGSPPTFDKKIPALVCYYTILAEPSKKSLDQRKTHANKQTAGKFGVTEKTIYRLVEDPSPEIWMRAFAQLPKDVLNQLIQLLGSEDSQ